MDKNQKWTRIKNRQDSKVDIKIFFNFQFLKLKLPICQSKNKVVLRSYYFFMHICVLYFY